MKRILVLFLTGLLCAPLTANVSLPNIFADNMVLQQNSEVKFWGWAKPREEVKVIASWSQDTLKTVANNQSHWELILNTPAAGGPHKILLIGNNSIALDNVLTGEVWLCSGQSNMEWKPTSGITDAETAIAEANFPKIRFFTVDHRTAKYPQIDLESSGWAACTPETMKNFSAVAYFFAKRFQEETGTPVGLINSSWGGTPAEAWTPQEVYKENKLLAHSAAQLQEVPWGPVEPGRLYNSMIGPLTKFRIAGALWYQGEANTKNADTYKETFSEMIKSWRDNWGYEFPFYFVQIAPFGYGEDQNGAKVRDAQRRTLELSHTGMAVICDVGDTTDIHPKNKKDVGIRLANIALKNHYDLLDEQVVVSPLYASHTVEGKQLIVNFKHSEGLYSKNKKSDLFELAGEDGIYYPATARIKNDQVIVQSKQVKNPVDVRYAWGNTTIADIFNRADLPASCFSSK